jgi:hypothetical protein
MNIPEYDIFSGRFGRDAVWIEAAEGLAVVVEKMKASVHSHGVLASVDTSIHSDVKSSQFA